MINQRRKTSSTSATKRPFQEQEIKPPTHTKEQDTLLHFPRRKKWLMVKASFFMAGIIGCVYIQFETLSRITLWSSYDRKQRPRFVQILDSNLGNLTEIPRLHWQSIPISNHSRLLEWPMTGIVHSFKQPDKIVTRDTCELVADWQTSHHPTCNDIHTLDLTQSLYTDKDVARLVNGGNFRDVWMVREYMGTMRALKTLRYSDKRAFDLRNWDRHRRDAVAYEQLTKSPYIANIYGHCAHGASFDFAKEGTLLHVFDKNPSKKELLEIAFRVAQSVADAHNILNGKPTIAHTDLKPDQWILVDGEYVLNDFNRVRFMAWDTVAKKPCGFEVGKNGGIWRSPEEYSYALENEKVDVWTLGNILYFLLMREPPWLEVPDETVYNEVKHGARPTIKSIEILTSDHPFEVAMQRAMTLCFVANPKNRPGAQSVAAVLQHAMMDWNRTVYQ